MNTTDSNTVSYKCTNCGAPLHYRPGLLSIHCDYCHATVAIKQEKKEEKKFSDTEATEAFDLQEGTIVHCKKCSAEYLKDDHTDVKNCMFCGARILREDVHDGFYVAPSHYLPFRVSEEEFKEETEELLKRHSIPSPFKSPKKFSNIRINRFYIPCWTDDINVHTDDKELETSYFEHRNLFIIASDYIKTYEYSNDLLPWNRNHLIPIDKSSLKDEKTLIFSFPSRISENSDSIILDRRKKQFEKFSNGLEGRKKGVDKIKKANLVLVPVYEFHFMYGNGENILYQNAYGGKFANQPFWYEESETKSCLIFILVIVAFFAFAWGMWKLAEIL